MEEFVAETPVDTADITTGISIEELCPLCSESKVRIEIKSTCDL
jgi:hypothetical protein